MKKTLFAALIILSSCSPKPCEQWKDWDFPKLKKITSCYEGGISLQLDGEPQTLWAMFEKKGFERGFSEGKLILNDDSAVFVKKGDPRAYTIKDDGRELSITSRPVKEVAFLSAAELARVDAYPQALEKWHASLKGTPAAFDSSKGTECDRALLSEALKPPTPDSKVPFLLNLDQLESGTETRVGVPKLLEVHERTAPNWLRQAAAELAVLEKRKAVLAFRVKNYVEPKFTDKQVKMEDGNVVFYTAGVVTLELALIELATSRATCRMNVTAKSSTSLNSNSNFDLDLAMNVGLAAQTALSFR